MAILKADQIYKSYTDTRERVDVLNGIDLDIHEAESLAIVGPSGAGKSTLLHILGGLDAPDRGRVMLNGQDLYRQNDQGRARLRRTEIGFVFQFYHLLPELTALENVLLPSFIAGGRRHPTADMKKRAREMLEMVGLSARLEHKPNQLSGGEQQRASIARALINNPRVVLCDEPTGNLDSHSGEAVIRILLVLNKDQGRTLVIVTHDEDLAASCARVVHMKDGLIIWPKKAQGIEIK